MSLFQAVMIDEQKSVSLQQLSQDQLPEGDVLVRIAYSTLNYKDALALTNSAPIVRQFPMVPGIDFSGVVEHSQHPDYKEGDKVVLNGWGVGEKHWGGLAQYARVPADYLVPLPAALSLRDAMIIGTAGYTAMLCVLALEQQSITPSSGDVLVTGAAGGVGSVAIALLAKLGYEVTALTGRVTEADYLHTLGAKHIMDRAEYAEAGRPLAKERWAAAVDVAGSHTLANVCASMRYRGVVAACGLAAGMDFPANMAPFILRGVKLIGVDSVMCPKADRLVAWQRLATDLNLELLQTIATEISLEEVAALAPAMLAGKVRGRTLVNAWE